MSDKAAIDPGLLDAIRAEVGDSGLAFTAPPRQCAHVMAELHRIDPESVVAKLGRRDVVGTALEGLHSDAAELGDATLLKRVERLHWGQPKVERNVLCHGQVHALSVIRSQGRDVLVDWYSARVNPLHLDLAAAALLMQESPTRMRSSAPGPVTAVGRRMAKQMLSHYRSLTGYEADERKLAWFQQLVAVRSVLELRSGRARGNGDEPTLELFRILEPILLRDYVGEDAPTL